MLSRVSLWTPRVVLGRRTGRATGALVVVLLTAISPAGPGFAPATRLQAVGTVVDATGSVTTDGGTVAGSAGAEPTIAMGSAPLVSAPLVTAPSDGTGIVVAAPTAPGTATATATIVPPSAPTGSGIPATVLAAYKNAETSLALSDPACHLSWPLLGGIGRVESGNAAGGRVDDAGNTRGRILGPRLDGTNGTVVIHDTDGGVLDGDTVYDRAVGPMQFIPSTWKTFGRDGNNDGVASPHNVFDAALSAGVYLCAGGSDLSQPIPQRAALMRYNNSAAYGDLVLRWAAAYAAGVSVLPNGQGDVPTAAPTPPSQVPAPASNTVNAPALAAAETTSSSTTTVTSTTKTSTTKTSATKTSTTTTTPTTTSSPTPTPTPTPPAPTSSPTTTTTPTTTEDPPPSETSTSSATSTTKSTSPESSSTVTTTPASEPTSTGSSSDSSDTSSTKTSTEKTSTEKTSASKTTKTSSAKASAATKDTATKDTATADGS